MQRPQRHCLRVQQAATDELVFDDAVAAPSKANISALALKRRQGVCYRTAWQLKHKILEGMRLAEADRQFTDRGEIDDADLGGERSGGKAGRGSENRVPFVAADQTTEDGLPHLACLLPRPSTNKVMEEFLARNATLPLALVSNGLNRFQVAASAGTVHDREITGGGKASALNEKFKAVNTLIGNVNTALTGTYHGIKFAKYAYRYLAEVQFRFNLRCDLRAILDSLPVAVVRAPRNPQRGIRGAELHS